MFRWLRPFLLGSEISFRNFGTFYQGPIEKLRGPGPRLRLLNRGSGTYVRLDPAVAYDLRQAQPANLPQQVLRRLPANGMVGIEICTCHDNF